MEIDNQSNITNNELPEWYKVAANRMATESYMPKPPPAPEGWKTEGWRYVWGEKHRSEEVLNFLQSDAGVPWIRVSGDLEIGLRAYRDGVRNVEIADMLQWLAIGRMGFPIDVAVNGSWTNNTVLLCELVQRSIRNSTIVSANVGKDSMPISGIEVDLLNINHAKFFRWRRLAIITPQKDKESLVNAVKESIGNAWFVLIEGPVDLKVEEIEPITPSFTQVLEFREGNLRFIYGGSLGKKI